MDVGRPQAQLPLGLPPGMHEGGRDRPTQTRLQPKAVPGHQQDVPVQQMNQRQQGRHSGNHGRPDGGLSVVKRRVINILKETKLLPKLTASEPRGRHLQVRRGQELGHLSWLVHDGTVEDCELRRVDRSQIHCEKLISEASKARSDWLSATDEDDNLRALLYHESQVTDCFVKGDSV